MGDLGKRRTLPWPAFWLIVLPSVALALFAGSLFQGYAVRAAAAGGVFLALFAFGWLVIEPLARRRRRQS